MPNSKSAKKSLRQNAKRRLRNRSQRSTLRTVIKKCRQAAVGDDRDAAEFAFHVATRHLDQAAASKLIHKNKAARTKSRLSKLLAAAPAAEKVSG